MAGLTTGAELAVRAGKLSAVTIRTSFERGQPGVRLVAIQTCLVALRCRLLLRAMAIGARGCLRPGMRFVATDAAGMSRLDQACLFTVTVVTPHFIGLGMVWQATVAALTRLMPFIQRGLVDARFVAPLAGHDARERELEGVRLVAARACGTAVGTVIRLSELVTRGAGVDVDPLG